MDANTRPGSESASKTDRLPRSPLLMSRGDTGVLVVDVQEKVIRLVPDHAQIIWNVCRLIRGAGYFGLPVVATEQYPQGLGGTVDELAGRLGEVPSKRTFSCGGCPQVFADLKQKGAVRILVSGIETHVCVQQTTLDLLADGFQVYLAVDAIGARHAIDHQTALRRMEAAGATLTTTEAALFEWCETSDSPEFRQISQLIQETHDESSSPRH